MKKSDKKIENNLRKALTIACEDIKEIVEDFRWLTHEVTYQKFPQSLMITCYFCNPIAIEHLKLKAQDTLIKDIICKQLSAIGVVPFNSHKQISFRCDD